ncbi:MAG: discoidin domain-containing protein [Prevotella sp.]|jgi:hypothetical protein|nr:discoidin domain-containing protein [Prevotella sp.]
MKKLLLLSACLIFGIGTKAQIFTDVNRNLYRDYQPFFQPDPRLMQHPTSPKQAKGKAKSAKGLPDHVNNGAALWFPPIFNQVGGSCGASSRIGYMMTYEWNAFHGSNASQLENRFPPHFEYPFSYNGLSKDQMAIYVGYPDGTHYGGSDVSSTYGAYETTSNDAGWMQGYDNWYNAMLHRIIAAANFPKSSLTEEGAEAIKWWLFNHNGDASWPVIEDDNGQHIVGGICGLGCGIAHSATSKIGSTATNNKLGVVGKVYLSHWNTGSVDHAITLVGYDDRIEFDLDGNGTYGESNNQLGQNEKGAWIVANSWGTGWGNKGFFYVPYAMAGGLSKQVTTKEGKTAYQDKAGGWYPEIYYLRQNYKPTRTMKVTMQYSKRSEISVVAGASQDTTSTRPEKEYVFRYINYTGDGDGNGTDAETPLLGRWADGKMHTEPMEFGIDLTDLSQDFDVTKPIKYFLTIQSKSSADGIGKICTASVIDYLFDSLGTETPFSPKNVQIQNQGKSTVIAVVVGGEATNPPANLTKTGNTLSWDKPQGTAYQPTEYVIYQDGKEIARTTNTTYETTAGGTYTVKALYTISGAPHLSPASNRVATAQTAKSAYDQITQTFSNGGFRIPNITKSRHSQFTLELWLKPSSIKSWNQQIGGPWGSFLLHANSDGTMYFGWDTYNRKLTSAILHNGQWTHLAVVVDKQTATLYANGESQGSVTSSSYSGFPAFSNGLLIGYASGSNNGIFGTIDEVRVWDVARSAQEIKDNETRPIASPATTPGLLAYLKMNTITVDGTERLQDCAHGNHASFINGNHSASTVGANTTLRHHDDIIASLKGASEALQGENIKYALQGGLDVATFSWRATHATPASTQASEASFVFNKTGEQTVTLKVTSLDGVTSTLTQTVHVKEATATADFEITNTQPKCGERTSFLSKNRAPGCTYQWTMQGANVQTAITQNAAAAFSTTGDHDVTLTVTTPEGKKLTKTAVVTVTASQTESESLENHGSALDRSAYRIVNVSDEETLSEYSPVEKAFDEDPSTFWHTAYHDGEKPYPHSVTIDKTTNDVIEGMQLYFARESSYRAVSAKIEQSADNIKWETLDEEHTFLDMERPVLVFKKPCTQRYLRITFLKGATNGNLMAINDISFYGKKEELSGKAPVTLHYESVSDEETNGETAPGRYAVDNDVTTFWHSHYSSSVIGYPHSITLSQPTGSRIDALTLVQRDHGATSSYYDAANMVIYAGDDKAHLDSIETIRIPFYVESTVRLPVPINKKYFQLKFTGSQYGSTKWLAICEIKAYQLSGEETGIQEIRETMQKEGGAHEKIYDLMGRFVGKDPKVLPPGIYIRNGKKFMIR